MAAFTPQQILSMDFPSTNVPFKLIVSKKSFTVSDVCHAISESQHVFYCSTGHNDEKTGRTHT